MNLIEKGYLRVYPFARRCLGKLHLSQYGLNSVKHDILLRYIRTNYADIIERYAQITPPI